MLCNNLDDLLEAPVEEQLGTRKNQWKQDPDGVRADILETATEVFAERGLSGARIDEIVRRTQTSKRMIYYYFGDKEGLYLSVLEAAYARVRAGEDELHLEELDPVSALRKLVEFTFDFHRAHPQYVRLVQIENIHNAAHMARSERIARLNVSAIDKLAAICRRGLEAGLFRPDINPIELHWLISSSCFFNVSNRATFAHLFGQKLYTDNGQAALRKLIVNAVLGAALKPDAARA